MEDKLYGWDQEVESNAIEVHIHNLRKKIGKNFIITKRGLGYQIGEMPWKYHGNCLNTSAYAAAYWFTSVAA